MEDNEALHRKQDELRQLAREAASLVGAREADADANLVSRSFARLTPPDEPQAEVHFITMSALGRGGGRSRKPGNVYLNWRKLIDVVPDVTLAGTGMLTSPIWVLPFIGLYLWAKLWRAAEEDISEVDATVIYALWKSKGGARTISEDEGFDKTNSVRIAAGAEPISREHYHAAVNRLLKMECIEISDGQIWLREWVRIAY